MDEYERKLSDLKKYIPFLDRVIEKLKKDGKSRESELERIQMLYAIITNNKKKCKLETLIKCESVLTKLHSTWEKRNYGHDDNTSTSTPKGSSEKNECIDLSAPASPQENFDKTIENHKPIVIPTERKYELYDHNNLRDVRSYDRIRSNSPRGDDSELYKRRSPSRHTSRYSTYDQHASSSNDYYRRSKYDIEKSRYASSEIYGHSKSKDDLSKQRNNDGSTKRTSTHTVTSDHNDQSKRTNSPKSIFYRLGEKFDITSKDSYENFKIKVSNDKTRIAIPPQPIADVLKSPPLSQNDINDLMNESGNSNDKSEKLIRNEKSRLKEKKKV